MSFIHPGFGGLGGTRRMRNVGNPWLSNMFGNMGGRGRNMGNIGGGGFMGPRGFMDPFTSNLLSSIDIFDPFDQIDRMMNRNLRWIDQPRMRSRSVGQQMRPRAIQQKRRPIQQQQQQRSRSRSQGLGLSTQMPQKYRISVDCQGFDPNQIRAQVMNVQNKKYLNLTCKDKRGQATFKRSFTLPQTVKPEKMCTFLAPNNQFVCEFPFLELPTSLDIDLVPQVIGQGKDKMVVVETRIPDFIDPISVNVCVKGHELVIRFEEKKAAPDSVSRDFYYNRVTLPINCDLNKINCVQRKRWLSIRCPVISQLKGGFRTVPIHRKLRHRLLEKLQDVKQKRTSSMIRPQVQQQQKTPGMISGWTQQQKQPQLQQQQQQKLDKSTVLQGKTTTQLGGGDKSMLQQQGKGMKMQQQGKTTGLNVGQGQGGRRIGSDVLHEVFGTNKESQWGGQQTAGGIQQQQTGGGIQQQQPGLKKKKSKSQLGTSTTDIQAGTPTDTKSDIKTAGVDIKSSKKDKKSKSTTSDVQSSGSGVTCGTCGTGGSTSDINKASSGAKSTSPTSSKRQSPTSSSANLQQSSDVSGGLKGATSPNQ